MEHRSILVYYAVSRKALKKPVLVQVAVLKLLVFTRVCQIDCVRCVEAVTCFQRKLLL